MSTYLQGVEDYIPQFQPFDPDLNFYANVLQTKQTQYDSNWRSLNKIYGQYFYSDLSRDANIAKKDELLKQIDFNLRRISGLDLSLEQNVEQALQVFKPFYEDQYLMKDMAWTKNYINNRTGALNLKSSKDEKNREMYWDTGVRAMDYMREEFRSVSDEESLRFQNVNYTPYKNINKLYMDLAKASGIQAETPSWSEDGRYKIITKNGEQIIQPLTYLFKAHAANDPQLQDIYRTQAYVNRKDYITQNAAAYNGDLVATERAYLTEQYNTIQQYVNQNKAESSQEKIVNDTKKAEAIKAIESGNDTMFTAEYLQRLEEASGSIDATDAYNTQLQETMSDGISTSTTTSYTPEQSEELEILRSKVDAGTAAMLMNQDIAEAAYVYSFKDYKVTTEADPYALESFRQTNREKLVELKRKADEKNIAVEHGLKTGYYVIDYATNQVKVNPKYDQTIIKVDAGSGASTEPFTAQELNEQIIEEAGKDYGESWVKSMSGLLTAYKNGNNVTDGQLSGILGEGLLNYGRLSTDDMLSQHISMGRALKRATQPWTEGFLSKASRTVANPVAALKEMAENPGKFLQDKSFDKIKKIKDGVDRFMYERVNLGDENAKKYHGLSLEGINTPEAQINLNFERYLLSKRAYEMVSEANNEIFEKEFKGTEAEPFSKMFWNNGQVLDEQTFISLAKEQLELEPKIDDGRTASERLSDLIDRRVVDVQKKYPLTPEQQKKFNAYITGVKNSKEGKYIFNDASRRDRVIRNWYAQEFNLDPSTGKKKTGYQTEEDLSRLYKQYKERLISLTVSNKLKSVSNAINDIQSEGGKFAITSQNSGRYINLNANNTPGYNAFVQFALGDMQALSKTQYEFSFDGNNVTAFDGDDFETPDERRNIGMQVLSLYTNLLNKGEKFEDPELYQGQIGKEDRNKGVMIFYPKLDALKSIIGTDKKPGVITQEQANRMVQNGIAIAAPRSTWKNELFMNSKIGGLEGILNMTPNGKVAVEHNDPIGGGFQILKDNTASAGYRVMRTIAVVDDYTGKLKRISVPVPEVNYGKNLDMTYLILRNQVAVQGSKNISDYKSVVDAMRMQSGPRNY